MKRNTGPAGGPRGVLEHPGEARWRHSCRMLARKARRGAAGNVRHIRQQVMEATPTTSEVIMTFFLRHRNPMLVVFAVAAAIGLSSCAETFTGIDAAEGETSVEQAAPLNDYYREGRTTNAQGIRTVPTPADVMSWDDTAADRAASKKSLEDGAPMPLMQSADSSSTLAPPYPDPKPRRRRDRY